MTKYTVKVGDTEYCSPDGSDASTVCRRLLKLGFIEWQAPFTPEDAGVATVEVMLIGAVGCWRYSLQASDEAMVETLRCVPLIPKGEGTPAH